MEEVFYYDRRKCWLYGVFLILMCLPFHPFTVFLLGGPGGVIAFVLIFLPLLLRGCNYIWKGFLSAPALVLNAKHLDIDNFYLGRQLVEWAAIKEIDYHYSPGMPRMSLAGFPIQSPFLMDTNFVTLLTQDGKKIKIRLDALKTGDRDLEQLLLDYKRMYYFQDAE